MNNDESNQSNQGQGAFVRRPIPKYNGDKSGGGEYQNQGGQGGQERQGGYSPRYSSGYGGDRQQRDGAQQSSYPGSERRGGRRAEGGGPGGYNGGGGGYKSGGYGYNRGGGNYGSNDRLIRQNDIIIQLLKDIRDRLPAPPGGTASRRSPDSYSSYSSRSSSPSYSEGGDEGGDFGASNAHNDSAGTGHSSGLDGNTAESGADDEEDRFDSGN